MSQLQESCDRRRNLWDCWEKKVRDQALKKVPYLKGDKAKNVYILWERTEWTSNSSSNMHTSLLLLYPLILSFSVQAWGRLGPGQDSNCGVHTRKRHASSRLSRIW